MAASPGSSPRPSAGGGASDDPAQPGHALDGHASADHAPGQAGQWSQLSLRHLYTLITEQIPRFRSRPFIADVAHLECIMRAGLASSLCDDFCWSLTFTAPFFARLCAEGFLPICCELGGGSGLYVLLPKLHQQRCILRFDAVHVPRKTRRRAKRYRLSVGSAFDEVIDGCIEQHGESWLYPPIRSLLTSLSDGVVVPEHAAARMLEGAHVASDVPAAASEQRPRGGPSGPPRAGWRVRVLSFELWDDGAADGATDAEPPAPRLIAGDVGVLVGASYTSFSGFHRARTPPYPPPPTVGRSFP